MPRTKEGRECSVGLPVGALLGVNRSRSQTAKPPFYGEASSAVGTGLAGADPPRNADTRHFAAGEGDCKCIEFAHKLQHINIVYCVGPLPGRG